jgi:hypothetical protein
MCHLTVQEMKTETSTRRFHQFSWLATVLLGLLIIQIAGCTAPPPQSSPEGSASMKQLALSFTPPAGKAGVYVIRPYKFYNDSYYGGSAFSFQVNLDYQEFGSLKTNSYLFALLPPGKHIFGTNYFTVEAGKNYYFTATGAGLTRFRHLQIDPISETDGQAYVRKFKLSGENRFEFQNQPGQTQ